MSLIKIAIAGQLVENIQDPRLLPATERKNIIQKPFQKPIKAKEAILNWGMKK